jgi:hypothetical protein
MATIKTETNSNPSRKPVVPPASDGPIVAANIALVQAQSSQTQLIYVDSVVGMLMGPYVCKLVFGNPTSADQLNPVVTLAMPVNAVYDLVQNLTRALAQSSVQDQLAAQYTKIQSQLRAIETK